MSEINIKSSTIEKGMELVKAMTAKLLGPAANELGELWSDNIKLWRLKNQIRIFEKVKKIVDEKGINIKTVNLKVLIPYLEGASLEEDDTLQNIWANLLTNYIDSTRNLVSNVFPRILSQLSTNEVEILKYMKLGNKNLIIGNYSKFKTKDIECEEFEIGNLERLGLISPVANLYLYNGPHEYQIEDAAPKEYYLT